MTIHRFSLPRLIFSALCCLLAATAGLGAVVKFDIPAQPAPAALKLFIKQSGVQVVFNTSDLKQVQSTPVVGNFEPTEAIALLLKDTGFTSTVSEGGVLAVIRVKTSPQTTGSVRGNLARETGAPAEGVNVMINETGQQARTDRSGEYMFGSVEPGTYILVVTAEGYQSLHITDVVVKPGSELTLSKEEMHVADGTLKLEPFVVRAESVTQLEKFEVTGTKEKPFAEANMDIPRTIDDVQPYYIFDCKQIDQSGATNVEDFLKQRLTMNTLPQTNSQIAGSGAVAAPLGTTSSINLRGLGTGETLILVNGRQMAGVSVGVGFATTNYQPDLNGIPLSAIDRIEVLPSSASGIYGGSAVGGVVNVILKKDYSGGEVRATYDNAFDTDVSIRTLAASYGAALEGGRTHFMLSASWSNSSSLLLQDRRSLFESGIATIQKNSPSYFYSNTSPFLGALPNIIPSSGSTATLTLKNGGPLGSRNTHVVAGTAPSVSPADLATSLKAGAGSWNFDLPNSTQSPTGLLRAFGATPKAKSFQAGMSRQMLPRLELFADFSYNLNDSKSVASPYTTNVTVPATAPENPFTTGVRVTIPDALAVPITSSSESEAFTLGAVVKLPGNWTGEFDYTWSRNRYGYTYYARDSSAMTSDLASGVLDPFVDTLLYPLNLEKYLSPHSFSGSSTLNDLALRGSGPLWSLPWGEPTLTVGLEDRVASTPETNSDLVYPLSPENDLRYTYFRRKQVTSSGYAEIVVPLLKRDWLPLVHSLDLQLAGRRDFYDVDTGTPYLRSSYNQAPPFVTYGEPTQNGEPYFAKTKYRSSNATFGFKYQPVAGLTLRASMATAFLPPTPDQLVKNPTPDPEPTLVVDPRTGEMVSIHTISGGNPNLKPQNSRSWNAGVVWEPKGKLLHGLRVDAEYYRINQFNSIGGLSPQNIVDLESTFPGRVVRDSSSTITDVDTSYLNLYKHQTEGWDLNADYELKTSLGTFDLRAAETVILHLKDQYAIGLPSTDSVDFPSEGGAARYKANTTLTWNGAHWIVAWTGRYYAAYKQNGAAGGPSATIPGAAYTGYLDAQGSDLIPSQLYHDLFVSYTFGNPQAHLDQKQARSEKNLLSGLTIQMGVRNIFDRTPPFDIYYSSNYYLSPYGDVKLRSYWLSIRKQF